MGWKREPLETDELDVHRSSRPADALTDRIGAIDGTR